MARNETLRDTIQTLGFSQGHDSPPLPVVDMQAIVSEIADFQLTPAEGCSRPQGAL